MLMKTFAAGLVAVSTLAAVPASAASMNIVAGPGVVQVQYGQGYGYGNGYGSGQDRDWRGPRDEHRYGNRWEYRQTTMSPREIRRALRRQGYRDVYAMDRRGRVYHVRAENYRGRPVALVVSARTGEILSVRRVHG
jgi:hypothetical protein